MSEVIKGTEGNDVLVGVADNEANGHRMGDGTKILAGNGNDTVIGSSENEYIKGGNGEDVLSGGAGHDDIRGDNGNDVMIGGAGNDILNGGGGTDLVVMSGKYSDYVITDPKGGWKTNFLVIKDKRGIDGTDYVQHQFTEYVQFSDGLYDVANRVLVPMSVLCKEYIAGRSK